MSTNNDHLEVDGKVVEVLRSAKFKVAIEVGESQHIVLCTLSGKLYMNKIKIVEGDKVTIKIPVVDLSKGIIVWRR